MPIQIPFCKAQIPNGLPKAILDSIAVQTFADAKKIEEQISDRCKIEYALATSSTTAALHLSMCALDLKRGDKVLCPVNSFVNIPEVVRHFDAEPVFVDTLPGSYAVDPVKLAQTAEKIKGKKLRAVIVSHIGGKSAPMSDIRQVADDYGLVLVEDATERTGAADTGRYSDLAVIGFGSKLESSFDGGMLLTNDESYFQRAQLLRDHGMVRTSREAGYMYDVLDIGCQYKMSGYDALYALAAWEENSRNIDRRTHIAKIYNQMLGGISGIRIPDEDKDHLYTQYIIEISTNRDTFARKLKERGIEVSVRYMPLNLTRYYKDKYKLKVFDFPAALEAYQKMISLPIYPSLSDEEAKYICESVISIAKTHK